MSDDRTGRELTPRPEEEPSAVTPRETGLTQPTAAPVERFSAGQQAHTVGLTEERAAQIVRQSSNARQVAFLAVLLVVLFIPLYWLYDIGLPAIGFGGRMESAADQQYVTDVSRGYALFLANCARCHGDQGQGGIGPPLNDQGKLYQAVTGSAPNYNSGKGHLNPDYILSVLTEGGRYVCGDANSVMPAWLQPKGPLDYRQVNDIISFIVASNQTSWVYQPPTAESVDVTPAPSVTVNGWRDPSYTPPPDATPVPACWRNPSGQIGGGGGGGATPTPGAITPGTPDNPRVIELTETADLHITDANGTPLSQIALVPGETVEFKVTNTAGFVHDLYIGTADQLQNTGNTSLPGLPEFSTGTQTFTYTVPASLDNLQFACTVPGHYDSMHGDLVAASGSSESPAPTASAEATPAPSASPSPTP
jgi:mono/diheme cytochrome c family protein